MVDAGFRPSTVAVHTINVPTVAGEGSEELRVTVMLAALANGSVASSQKMVPNRTILCFYPPYDLPSLVDFIPLAYEPQETTRPHLQGSR